MNTTMWVVDETDKHAMSAVMKICKEARPGAVIRLTNEEFKAMKNLHPIYIPERKTDATT